MVIRKRDWSFTSTANAIVSSVEFGLASNSAMSTGNSSSSIRVVGNTSPNFSVIRCSVSGQLSRTREIRPLRDIVVVGKLLNIKNGSGREGWKISPSERGTNSVATFRRVHNSLHNSS